MLFSKMASSISILSSPSIPKIRPSFRASNAKCSITVSLPMFGTSEKKKVNNTSSFKLKAAGLNEIEPDLNEDPVDRWKTNGVSAEDFKYGIYDGHHTYYEAEHKENFWESLREEYESADPPTGFQGFISWMFPPAIAAGMYFHVPGEYLFIGAGLFTIVFCIIEMDKPDKPHNFEPQIYNLDRGVRDKLLADYNTMDIWEFNEKYGDFWDFTIKRDNVTKRDD